MTWPPVSMGTVLARRPLDVVVESQKTYTFAGVRSFGRGVFRSVTRTGAQTAYRELTRVRAGDLTYPKLMAWEGAIGAVPDDCDGCVVSPEFPVFEIDRGRALPEYLDYWWRSPAARPLLSGGSTGLNVRRRRLNPSDFLAIKIPLPPVSEQRRIADRIRELLGLVGSAEDVRSKLEKARSRLPRATTEAVYERLLTAGVTRQLGDLVAVAGGGTPDTSRPDFWNGPIPWVCPKDMKRFEIDSSIDTITESATAASPAKLIDSPAVLVVVRGMILVRTAPVAVTKVPVAVNQDMKALLPETGLDAEFLAWMLRGAERRILDGVETSGHGTKRLPPGILERLPIPVLDATEQAAVCREMRAKTATTEVIAARVEQSDREIALLRDRVLNSAFAGALWGA